jgi:hypothetical protein
MEMERIKSQTYAIWCELHKLNQALILPENFLAEVATYGDLEQIETWKAAFASLKAKFLAQGCPDDGQYFIEFYLLYASEKWGWRSLLPRVLAQLEMYPEAVQEIADGLRKIGVYGCEYGATVAEVEQLKEILINGNSEKWRGLLQPESTAIPA